MASLLLADEVISFTPVVQLGAAALSDNLEITKCVFPGSVNWLSKAEWAIPLFLDKLIVPMFDSIPCYAYLPEFMNIFKNEETWGELFQESPLAGCSSNEEMMDVFAAMCSGDGFGDPSSYIICHAALDYFALMHGLVISKEHRVRKPEREMGVEIAARLLEFATPVVLATDGDQILEARDILKDQLHPFRIVVQEIQEAIGAIEEADWKMIEAEIDKRILPLLKDYRDAFRSRVQLATNAVVGVEHLLIGGLTGAMSLGFGAPIGTVAASGALSGFASVGTRLLTGLRQQEQKRRTHSLGFLAALEGR